MILLLKLNYSTYIMYIRYIHATIFQYIQKTIFEHGMIHELSAYSYIFFRQSRSLMSLRVKESSVGCTSTRRNQDG